MTRRFTPFVCTLALAGCAASAPSASPSTSGPDDPKPHADDVAAASVAPEVSTTLSRQLHVHPMTEVVLDAHGRGALTLDDRGGVRLWPDLLAADVGLPVALPEQEPIWMSLGRVDEGTFVVATIDTAGSARVSRISIDTAGARRVALFEIPAVDPQFEIHVLDGGRRVLALGKDHRVRLFDDGGRVLSKLDERSFIPWQLRVVETPNVEGHTRVALAAVLTQPVRAQSLTLVDDTLAIVGEGRMVALDQSPNRNDLALSPDGTTIAALRRTAAKKPDFSLQLIDLASGDRRVIVGALDEKARGRLHYVDQDRVLLESGSGKGFWIELAQAVPRDAAAFPPAVMQPVSLPGAIGDLRMQVTLAAGVRAIATGPVLTVDPIATADHRELQRTPLDAGSIALDATGNTLAWGRGREVHLEATGDATASRVFDAGETVRGLGFDGDGRVVVTTASGTTIRDDAGVVLEPGPASAPDAAADPRAMLHAASVATVGLPLRGRTALAATPSPTGSLLAVALSQPHLPLSDRESVGVVLGVFDRDHPARLWTSPLDRVGNLAWSGDGERLATHDGLGIRVVDAHTGKTLFSRTDAGLVVAAAQD